MQLNNEAPVGEDGKGISGLLLKDVSTIHHREGVTRNSLVITSIYQSSTIGEQLVHEKDSDKDDERIIDEEEKDNRSSGKELLLTIAEVSEHPL